MLNDMRRCAFPHAERHERCDDDARVEHIACVNECARCRVRQFGESECGLLCGGIGADGIGCEGLFQIGNRDGESVVLFIGGGCSGFGKCWSACACMESWDTVFTVVDHDTWST
jgi:hypothetical protein